LGVLVDKDGSVLHSGGYIVQVMPGLPDAQLERLENAISAMPHVTALLDQGETPESLLHFLVGEDSTIHQTIEPVFKCKCSRERFEKVLITLGKKEIRSMIEEDGKAELHCHFCNEKYLFDADELVALHSLSDRN
jgi:molecular chaperone Hsp33